ncbi:hypothetical protein N7537_010637 [Penicillium hordei]|uniref:LysM domain-containing protein n=1 Tax=Penicillium hordei TaxID=40994 RepID=A0AAD6DV08_9EURO|nr:uncharacterized protein N7537_010637 [Penicillium hordei]KAJ5593733.1 hypothetical protein N7537_010637 [Penicillium hordei]
MAAALTRCVVNCDFSTPVDAGATWSSFASSWGLSVNNLLQLNPGIACPNLDTSKAYCVIGTATDEPSSTTSTTTTTTTTTKISTTTESIPSNSPTIPGIATNCDGFHKVLSVDQCNTIAANEAQFKSWNSQMDANCLNLWLDYYACVHVPGTTTTPAPQPTAEPTGPTPQMPGIVSNFKTYHRIKNGDSCYTIGLAAKITLAQFRAWNTQVDATCSNLWLEYHVYIGV